MSKLSTAQLKDMITQWFATPEVRTQWENDYNEHFSYPGSMTFPEFKERYKDDPTYLGFTKKQFAALSSFDQVSHHLIASAVDGKQWIRGEKSRLGAENGNGWQTHFAYTCKYTAEPINEKSYRTWQGEYVTQFPDDAFTPDHLGDSDEALVKELCAKGEAELDKCIERVFYPKIGLIADNYRLHIITDPTDTRVVGWSVIVD